MLVILDLDAWGGLGLKATHQDCDDNTSPLHAIGVYPKLAPRSKISEQGKQAKLQGSIILREDALRVPVRTGDWHTRISDEGLLRLKAAPRINELNLFYAEWITDQGLTAIRDWKHLKRLNLRGTRNSDGTLAIVTRLTGLEALNIASTQVTDNGLDYLITPTNLKELAIGNSRLGDNASEVLRMLSTLTYLDLSGARANRPDLPGRRAGGGFMPDCMIRALAGLKDLRTLGTLEMVEKLGLESCTGSDDSAAAELTKWKRNPLR